MVLCVQRHHVMITVFTGGLHMVGVMFVNDN